MKPLQAGLVYACLIPCALLANVCLGAGVTPRPPSDIALVASTPGDAPIKSLLTIPAATKVDFIRWDLTLHDQNLNQKTFALHIVFGEAQPNTLGFKNGGEKRSFAGTYVIVRSWNTRLQGEIYRLKSKDLPAGISLVKLNGNLFHLLTPEDHLAIGNGGWSYTLNSKQPAGQAAGLPALTDASAGLPDTTPQVTFDGRTPCLDFAREHHLPVTPDCFKLKWSLTLHRDPKTALPTTYTLKRTGSRQADITGKWTMVKGTPANPRAIIYQLDPDKPEKTLSLLVGDENVLFFLNKDQQLYVGNGDFSFTLNRRTE